ELSPELRSTAGGALADEMLTPVRFGSSASDLVSVDAGTGSVSLDAVGLDISRPEVDADRVTYRDVADGVDLVYSTTNASVTKELVLRDAGAQSSFTFRLTGLDGFLAPEQIEDGSWVFRSKSDDGVSFANSPGAIATGRRQLDG